MLRALQRVLAKCFCELKFPFSLPPFSAFRTALIYMPSERRRYRTKRLRERGACRSSMRHVHRSQIGDALTAAAGAAWGLCDQLA